jgi:hypothetical protein
MAPLRQIYFNITGEDSGMNIIEKLTKDVKD